MASTAVGRPPTAAAVPFWTAAAGNRPLSQSSMAAVVTAKGGPFCRPLRMDRRRCQTWRSQSPREHSLRLGRVVSGEAEGNPSTEGMVLDEDSLQRDLEIAIKEEDYERAANLRDCLQVLYEDSKAAVLSANARFYHAFKNGDLAAMHSIWTKGDHIYVVHPGAGRISGYDLVMGSWEIVCNADYEFPLQIDLRNVEVYVRGSIGYVSCMEIVKTKGSSWGKQVATNVFEKVNGQWFMCIHHASHIDG